MKKEILKIKLPVLSSKRKTWEISPVTKPHSSKKGKKGYSRKKKDWKNIE